MFYKLKQWLETVVVHVVALLMVIGYFLLVILVSIIPTGIILYIVYRMVLHLMSVWKG